MPTAHPLTPFQPDRYIGRPLFATALASMVFVLLVCVNVASAKQIFGLHTSKRPRVSMRQWKQILRKEFDHKRAPILGHDEIQSVDTIGKLQQLYHHKGHNLDYRGTVEQVVHDWIHVRTTAIKNGLEPTGPSPETLPGLAVEVGKHTHHLYGLAHPKLGLNPLEVLANGYLEAMFHTIRRHPRSVRLSEQNLVTGGFGYPFGMLELADHSIHGLALTAYRGSIFYLTSEKVRTKLKELRRNTMASRDLVEMVRNTPAGLLTEAPTYVEFEVRANSGKFTVSQRRSAYMAAILRRLNHPAVLFAGAAHPPEVAYFLKHPLKDARVERLAKKHADAFNHGGIEKAALAIAKTRRVESAIQKASAAASGAAIALTPNAIIHVARMLRALF